MSKIFAIIAKDSNVCDLIEGSIEEALCFCSNLKQLNYLVERLKKLSNKNFSVVKFVKNKTKIRDFVIVVNEFDTDLYNYASKKILKYQFCSKSERYDFDFNDYASVIKLRRDQIVLDYFEIKSSLNTKDINDILSKVDEDYKEIERTNKLKASGKFYSDRSLLKGSF